MLRRADMVEKEVALSCKAFAGGRIERPNGRATVLGLRQPGFLK